MLKEENKLRKLIEEYSNNNHYVQNTRIGRSKEREVGYLLITAFGKAVREGAREAIIAEGNRRGLHSDAYQWAAETAVKERI